MLIPKILTRAIALGATWFDKVVAPDPILAPCESPIHCYGEILHQIQMARPFVDSKTYVDMPTRSPLTEIQKDYRILKKPVRNGTELMEFLGKHFRPAGQELKALKNSTFVTNATFLDDMDDVVNREFVGEVLKKWKNLTRSYEEGSFCDHCTSSFIPVKRPFVIAGGRFREPYYWDSYWIIHGLLRTGGSFTEIARDQIENFLDNVAEFGFVPNGSRKYYLNRSQPPLLAQMVRIYIEFTGDTSILEHGLALLVQEHTWFEKNRHVNVVVDGHPQRLNRYNVENNQPRPESYHEDYEQANNETRGRKHFAPEPIETERHRQYRNLASGAESGWDFSSRFLSHPGDAAGEREFPLRSLNVVNMVPVELNSFLYWNEKTISSFFALTGDLDEAAQWDLEAQRRSKAMHAVFWNEEFGRYFDYNLTSESQELFGPGDDDSLPEETKPAPKGQQVVFNTGQLTPFLTGAAQPHIRDDPRAVRKAFEMVSAYLDARRGGIAPTNYRSHQQWDQFNAWPPHQQMLMEALLNTPSQPPANGTNGTTTGKKDDPEDQDDTEDYRWTQDLALRLGQRYLDSTYCTWRMTGGQSENNPPLKWLVNTTLGHGGLMFEKYRDDSLIGAGDGGEYEVVVGFGWTNGVLVWVADTFRGALGPPPCTRFEDFPAPPGGDAKSAVYLDPWDAEWTSQSVGGKAPLIF